MADNVAITAGAGTTVATDDVGGVHFQRVKLVDGALDGTAAIGGDATNGLDVDVTRVQGVVQVGDNSGSLTVDAPVGTPAFVRLSDGSAAITALPVTDNGSTLSIDDGAGSITVDGAVAATQSGTWNIGTVTAVTGPVPVTDNSGSLTVDDGAGSLTVDGNVTGHQGTAAAASGAWPVKISDGSNVAGLSSVSAAYAVKVDVVQAVGAGAQTDKSTFTEGSTKFDVVGGVYNETISADPSEDQAAAARITAKRAIHVNVRNVAGAEVGIAAAPLRTDPTGTTTQPTLDTNSAAALTALQLIDDAVGATGAAIPAKGDLVIASDGGTARAIACNASGHVSVNDGGNSVTVDAPVGTPAFVRLSDGSAAITALPVTDNGSTLSIDDGAGSITVDGAVAATQSGTWNIGTVTAVTGPVPVTDNSGSLTVDSPQLPAALVGGRLPVRLGASIPVVPTGPHIGSLGGRTPTVRVTLTRPADTTAYTSGDAVGTASSAVLTFNGCARVPNGTGRIAYATILDEANVATKAVFELWIFDTAITAVADNAAWAPTHAEMETHVCTIQFADTAIVGLSGAGASGNCTFRQSALRHPFACIGKTTKLYGYLVVRNAYVPVSAEKFQVTLGIEQDPVEYDGPQFYPDTTDIDVNSMSLIGYLPSLACCPGLTSFNGSTNAFTGVLPSFAANTALTTWNGSANAFTGVLPSFAACTALQYFRANSNSFSGTLPSFAACTALLLIYCQSNSFSGTIPSFNACTLLNEASLHTNSFSGTLPTFAACTALTYIHAGSNSLTAVTAGSFATQANLATLNLSSNALPAAEVNKVLADLVVSLGLGGRVICTVTLSGGTNAAPTGQGVTDKNTLVAAGWTVTTT